MDYNIKYIIYLGLEDLGVECLAMPTLDGKRFQYNCNGASPRSGVDRYLVRLTIINYSVINVGSFAIYLLGTSSSYLALLICVPHAEQNFTPVAEVDEVMIELNITPCKLLVLDEYLLDEEHLKTDQLSCIAAQAQPSW